MLLIAPPEGGVAEELWAAPAQLPRVSKPAATKVRAKIDRACVRGRGTMGTGG